MPSVENTNEGPRGFCVDHAEYLVPARRVVGDRIVNGSLDVDDAVLANAQRDEAFRELCDVGVFVVVSTKKAAPVVEPKQAAAPAPVAPVIEPVVEPTPAPAPEPTPEPKAEGATAVESKAKGKTK